MKYITKLKAVFVAAMALFISAAVSACPTLSLSDVEPYIGADSAWQLLHAKSNGRSLKHNEYMPKLNLYAGIKFNDFGRIEAGTLIQKSRIISGSKLRKTDTHITVLGAYPISEGASLLGGVGLTRAKLTYLQPTVKRSVVKIAPRLVGGAEYALGNNVNVRGTIAYHMTHGLRIGGIKPRDSYLISGGLNYSF
jgi:opacity protein-like surface antigen